MQAPSLLNLLSAYNIVIYMLVFTRLTGMIQTAPFFSSLQAPMMTKIWFGAVVSFIIYPLVYASKAFVLPKDMTEFLISTLIFPFAVNSTGISLQNTVALLILLLSIKL